MPVAEGKTWVMFDPPLFHPLATAVSDAPAWSVAALPGEVMATRDAVMAMAGENAEAELTARPALASVPDAADAAMKLPCDCAVNATWKTCVAPPAIVVAPGDGTPDCVAGLL